MTADENATNWRGLADMLTPEQVAELEYCEREGIPPGLATPQGHLNCAQMMVRHNFIQQLCADVAPPVDAIDEPSGWQEWDDGYGRMYAVSSRDEVGDMSVQVLGVQFDDGRVERYILADGVEQMTAAEARQLAAALTAAADELGGSAR